MNIFTKEQTDQIINIGECLLSGYYEDSLSAEHIADLLLILSDVREKVKHLPENSVNPGQ